MNPVFVDTSAFLAVLDRDDLHHSGAVEQWRQLLEEDVELHCTVGVLIETCALLQRRLGMAALRAFCEEICPLLAVEWLEEPTFREGMVSVLAVNRRSVSLVDCMSFAAMRHRGIRRCFAYDRHFGAQGFDVVG